MLKVEVPWSLGAQLCLECLPLWVLSPGKTEYLSCLLPCLGRNAAGKDGKERLGGSVLEQIPFLQNCEDEDSDEDDELDSVQHKKQRVRVSLPLLTSALALWPQIMPHPTLPIYGPAGQLSALTHLGCLCQMCLDPGLGDIWGVSMVWGILLCYCGQDLCLWTLISG